MNPSRQSIKAAQRRDAIQDTIRGFTLESLGLDRADDPMGMRFEWLTGPQSPFQEAYERLVNYSPLRWQETVGPALKRLLGHGQMHAGDQGTMLQEFVSKRFPALCRSEGADGQRLMNLLTLHGNRAPGVVEEVCRFLSNRDELAALNEDERVALALLIIDRYGSKRAAATKRKTPRKSP